MASFSFFKSRSSTCETRTLPQVRARASAAPAWRAGVPNCQSQNVPRTEKPPGPAISGSLLLEGSRRMGAARRGGLV